MSSDITKAFVARLTAWADAEGAEAGQSLNWFALADAAQDPQLPAVLASEVSCRSLFGASVDSPLGAQSPWLVQLPAPNPDEKAWKWLARHAAHRPCATVIASDWLLDQLTAHLQGWLDVKLPDGDGLFLAIWDPAILATLVGQADDSTLHVPGPVLTPGQRRDLLAPVDAWHYWDRTGAHHRIVPLSNPPSAADPETVLPLQLTQAQVDDLVEASVPDHVLYHVQTNQPMLLDAVPPEQRYGRVRALVVQGQALGLEVMREWVDFVCAALIYGERMQSDPTITGLLRRLQAREIRLDEALDGFPP